MGLCKCPKRKVTNLFCFEHDVNVCEDCLVTDHERCIVQSYVQWLQDSDYNPICILCKNLLKDEDTVRLACYDVFHWRCINKYASELPANTAPAGYQCPKCKECIFPPSNIVSPVVDVLRNKLESVEWSRAGLGQSLLKIEDAIDMNDESNSLIDTEAKQDITPTETNKNNITPIEDESNDFVFINEQHNQIAQNNRTTVNDSIIPHDEAAPIENLIVKNTKSVSQTNNIKHFKPQQQQQDQKQTKIDMFGSNENILSHNRTQITDKSDIRRSTEPVYDPSLGIVLNINNLDRDIGENKYQRRPVFEWLSRWLKSRQMSGRMRMTRQKKNTLYYYIHFSRIFYFDSYNDTSW